MTPEEADKIIAEFMGLGFDVTDYHPVEIMNASNGLHKRLPRFSQSLDSLVPVWEKLNLFDLKFNAIGPTWNEVEIRILDHDIYEDHKSIYTAAAIATAKAIQEFK